jgi:hypothetical protein
MNLFDVRFAAIVISIWSVIIVALMLLLGFFDSPFFHLGPSANALFFGKPIDTWPKYAGIVIYIVIQQIISTYGLETISPWMINQVQNRRVTRMRERNVEILAIILCWYTYMWISRVVSIQILLSQIDFLAIVLLVDLATTFFVTYHYYLRRKQTGVILTETDFDNDATKALLSNVKEDFVSNDNVVRRRSDGSNNSNFQTSPNQLESGYDIQNSSQHQQQHHSSSTITSMFLASTSPIER